MLAKRIIPCLDVTAGRVVKGVNFVELRDAGDPVEIAARYNEQGADELTFLDITATSDGRDVILHIIEAVASQVFIPLTVGGGVRAVRLQAVLMILERRFAEPDFSAHKLAAAAGLSERYVNELLYEAGASLTSRLLELRLRRAAKWLAQAGDRRISEIAFDCGFNDLSYFNRCFRRRFGLTPSAARGR